MHICGGPSKCWVFGAEPSLGGHSLGMGRLRFFSLPVQAVFLKAFSS